MSTTAISMIAGSPPCVVEAEATKGWRMRKLSTRTSLFSTSKSETRSTTWIASSHSVARTPFGSGGSERRRPGRDELSKCQGRDVFEQEPWDGLGGGGPIGAGVGDDGLVLDGAVQRRDLRPLEGAQSLVRRELRVEHLSRGVLEVSFEFAIRDDAVSPQVCRAGEVCARDSAGDNIVEVPPIFAFLVEGP